MLLYTACVHSSVWLWSVHLLGHQEWCSLHDKELLLTCAPQLKKITYASGLNTSFLHTCRITVTNCMSQFVYLIWYSLWWSWVKEHHGLCCSWELAEVSINEDGFCSCDTGHGLQVAVMPAVSLHVIVWYEGFASLCQSNYPDHLHFAFHLHISVVTIC